MRDAAYVAKTSFYILIDYSIRTDNALAEKWSSEPSRPRMFDARTSEGSCRSIAFEDPLCYPTPPSWYYQWCAHVRFCSKKLYRGLLSLGTVQVAVGFMPDCLGESL